jgi:hypothetical protein
VTTGIQHRSINFAASHAKIFIALHLMPASMLYAAGLLELTFFPYFQFSIFQKVKR